MMLLCGSFGNYNKTYFILMLKCCFLLMELTHAIQTAGRIYFSKGVNNVSYKLPPGLPISECIDDCTSVNYCSAVEYVHNFPVCLFYINATTEDLVSRPGSITVFKNDFKKSRDVVCQSRNCDEVTECGPPPPIAGATLHGNLLNVGARVMYVCQENERKIAAVCQTDGQWSPTPDCLSTTAPTSPTTTTVATNITITSAFVIDKSGWYKDLEGAWVFNAACDFEVPQVNSIRDYPDQTVLGTISIDATNFSARKGTNLPSHSCDIRPLITYLSTCPVDLKLADSNFPFLCDVIQGAGYQTSLWNTAHIWTGDITTWTFQVETFGPKSPIPESPNGTCIITAPSVLPTK